MHKAVVVVAQLAEQSFLIPEVHGSNSVIGKNVYVPNMPTTDCWKDENKEKRDQEWSV